MAVNIIVEDGTIVSGANTFVGVASFRQYCGDRNITLPADNNAVAAMLIKGTDYLETLDKEYIGVPVNPATQSLKWPRKELHGGTLYTTIGRLVILPTVIPSALIKAQLYLTTAIVQGVDLAPVQTGPMVTMEKVDVIETHYSEAFGDFIRPVMPTVDALLKPLIAGSQFFLSSVRV